MNNITKSLEILSKEYYTATIGRLTVLDYLDAYNSYDIAQHKKLNEELQKSANSALDKFCKIARDMTNQELMDFAFVTIENKEIFKASVKYLDKNGELKAFIRLHNEKNA